MTTSTMSTEDAGNAVPETWISPFYRVETLDGGHYRLMVEMPGVSKENLSLSMDQDVLTITGIRDHHHYEDLQVIFRECPEGDYRLTLTLNVEIDSSRIKASVKDGVLSLTLPIKEVPKPRQIMID